MRLNIGWTDAPTKRGRGQRRSRRQKNISLDEAQRQAIIHMLRNPPLWPNARDYREHLNVLTHSFRASSRGKS